MGKRIISLSIFTTLLAIPFVQDLYGQEENEPTIYHTGMILTNLGDIDRQNGHYWMDFVIFIEADGVDFTKETPSLSFVNGRNLLFSDELIEPNYYEIRVQGEFFNEFDYHMFPFHEIIIKVEVEPKVPFDTSRVIFEPTEDDPIDPSLSVHGWKLMDSEVSQNIHVYPDGLAFSRYVVNFKLYHEPVGVALSTLLPVTILTSIALLIFIIPENFTPRIYLTAPILLAVVYWHQSNLSHLPVLGYLTFFDKIILIYYALFVNAILSLSRQMRIQINKEEQLKVKKINRDHAIFIPVIVIVGMIILFVF